MIRKTVGLQIVLLAVLVASFGQAAAQTVRAYVEPPQAAVGQTFTLSVEIAGGSPSEPETPQFGDFAAFLGRGSSQRIELINGRMSSSRTINYTYQATKAGSLTIGPIAVEVDGKVLKTDPISFEIVPSAGGTSAGSSNPSRSESADLPQDALFIRAIPSRREVYVNQPVVVTYKIYTRIDLNAYSFAKLPLAEGFWAEDYPTGPRPQTDVEVIDGRRYTTAVVKKMALYPTSPGAKTLTPLQLQCEVTLPRRRDPFFDDFFGGGFGRLLGQPATQIVNSDEVQIQVLPLPSEGQPDGFKGAVGQFSVDASLDKAEVQTNDAVTLRVRVSGSGNFPTMGEPAVTLPPTLETYPPKTSEKIDRGAGGLAGSRTYEYVLIPRVAGEEVVGPVKLPYFDPETKSYRLAGGDALKLKVTGGNAVADGTVPAVSKQELKLLGQDIRFIKTDPGQLRKIGVAAWPASAFWLAVTLPLVALAGALVYRRRLDRLRGDVAYARDRRAKRLAKKRLGKARSLMKTETREAFFAEAGKALSGFLADKLNLAEAGMLTEQVRTTLLERGVASETVEAYLDCLRVCDRERFAPSQPNLEGMREFLEKAEKAMGRLGGEL